MDADARTKAPAIGGEGRASVEAPMGTKETVLPSAVRKALASEGTSARAKPVRRCPCIRVSLGSFVLTGSLGSTVPTQDRLRGRAVTLKAG